MTVKGKRQNKKKESAGSSKKELDILRNQLARALADYDNLRKRTDKAREHFSKIASLELIARLLPIYDMLNDAQKHLKDSGIEIVLNEFEQALKEEGVVKIKSEKTDYFDESLHEAVEVIKKENMEGKIIETLLTGWRYEEGPIIRPAKVKVGEK